MIEGALEFLVVGLLLVRLACEVVVGSEIDDNGLAGRDALRVAGSHLQLEETVLRPTGAIRFDVRVWAALAHAHVVLDVPPRPHQHAIDGFRILRALLDHPVDLDDAVLEDPVAAPGEEPCQGHHTVEVHGAERTDGLPLLERVVAHQTHGALDPHQAQVVLLQLGLHQLRMLLLHGRRVHEAVQALSPASDVHHDVPQQHDLGGLSLHQDRLQVRGVDPLLVHRDLRRRLLLETLLHDLLEQGLAMLVAMGLNALEQANHLKLAHPSCHKGRRVACPTQEQHVRRRLCVADVLEDGNVVLHWPGEGEQILEVRYASAGRRRGLASGLHLTSGRVGGLLLEPGFELRREVLAIVLLQLAQR
eukprot:11176660-Lingulodinium_polyedra.AAC.4